MLEGEGQYRVLFVHQGDLRQIDKGGTITISASPDGWNDFGDRILVDICVRPRSQIASKNELMEFGGFFGFLKNQNGGSDTSFLRELTGGNAGPIPSEEAPRYFTMLPNMESYRRLVSQLGPDEARLVLRAMHDIVEADDRPSGKQWLRAATESPIFQNAFLRRSEAYFAWKNASPILRGLEFEELDRISKGLRIQFRLAGRPNSHDLKFRFSEEDKVLPRRFAVVIGKNGVGKSQTLSQIIDAALRGDQKLTDLDGNRPAFNRILGFYPSASFSPVFPSERRKRARFWYRRFPMVSSKSRARTSDLIVQLARSIEGIAGKSRYDIFLDAISAIDGARELVFQTNNPKREPISIFALDQGGEQERLNRFASIKLGLEPVRMIEGKTYPVSSGEHSFLRFAALASLYIENGSLMLFDEPETHLHPNFISQFVSLLDRLLNMTGSAAILATHSVYFVREALEDQVTVLRSDVDRTFFAETPTLKTFGADVGAISYFVFGEDKPSRLAQDVETKIIKQAKSWEEVFEIYKDRVSLDLLSEIRAQLEGTDKESGTR